MRSVYLLSLALAAGAAQAQEYGDWMVDDLASERSVYAATVNDSGGLLGKTCSQEGCRWIVTLKANCENGAKYPALLNAADGAWHVTLFCSPNEKNPGRYYVLEPDYVDKAVQSGDAVGIAMPMQSGQFRVARFSTRGWTAAVRQLWNRTEKLLKRPGESTL